ncbi:hypothetical protein F8388_004656 [Cannabis sativa]|uniref:Uncharacterized protein n=1 Tax=Cannabis sativa TaxID=3483 RepID=A0A7J6DWB8_CANSA|nr:hypothetical protein F8388_004656 [Cannabis sativa]KAF4402214.1 hypothetical protein G4B88_017726 [Cannabis sativa]
MVGIEGIVVGIVGRGGSVTLGIEGTLLAGFVGSVGKGLDGSGATLGFGKVGRAGKGFEGNGAMLGFGNVGRVGKGLEGMGGIFGLGSGGAEGNGGNVGLGRAGILGNAGGGAAGGVSKRWRVAKIGLVESDKAMIIDRIEKILRKPIGESFFVVELYDECSGLFIERNKYTGSKLPGLKSVFGKQ